MRERERERETEREGARATETATDSCSIRRLQELVVPCAVLPRQTAVMSVIRCSAMISTSDPDSTYPFSLIFLASRKAVQ